jgi:hypothetical protein
MFEVRSKNRVETQTINFGHKVEGSLIVNTDGADSNNYAVKGHVTIGKCVTICSRWSKWHARCRVSVRSHVTKFEYKGFLMALWKVRESHVNVTVGVPTGLEYS